MVPALGNSTGQSTRARRRSAPPWQVSKPVSTPPTRTGLGFTQGGPQLLAALVGTEGACWVGGLVGPLVVPASASGVVAAAFGIAAVCVPWLAVDGVPGLASDAASVIAALFELSAVLPPHPPRNPSAVMSAVLTVSSDLYFRMALLPGEARRACDVPGAHRARVRPGRSLFFDVPVPRDGRTLLTVLCRSEPHAIRASRHRYSQREGLTPKAARRWHSRASHR